MHPGSSSGVACAQAALDPLTTRDFERLVGEGFRRRGFTVTGFGGSGADLALRKSGERFLVDFKNWRKPQVGVAVVRELATLIEAVGASGGYVITRGTFTREARDLARSAHIELIDGRMLAADWLRAVEAATPFKRAEVVPIS
jgi:restriction system protein